MSWTGVYVFFSSVQPQPPGLLLMQFVCRNTDIVPHLALVMMTVIKGDGAAVTHLQKPSLSRQKTVVRHTLSARRTLRQPQRR